jgi:hypothetical protein
MRVQNISFLPPLNDMFVCVVAVPHVVPLSTGAEDLRSALRGLSSKQAGLQRQRKEHEDLVSEGGGSREGGGGVAHCVLVVPWDRNSTSATDHF